MEENLLKYQTILTEITGISKKYDEIAQLTGENFNVFNIVGFSETKRFSKKQQIKSCGS